MTSVTGLGAVAARTERPFQDLEDVARRTRLPARLMEPFAAAGAFDGFGEHRRTALWTAGAFPRSHQPYLPAPAPWRPPPTCP
ncbi:hypothetical protein [Streptomyces scabichelini]|uniref:helix-hairpin-helix domain-containing protein n=1 Tax=Streptomyces scabichelini TaxID=2711217 RepID=UPI001F496570|nr:hypothetical protein [Streptomyces scabichelini]